MHRAKREEGEDESDAGHEKKVDKTGGGDGGNSGGNVSEEKEVGDGQTLTTVNPKFIAVPLLKRVLREVQIAKLMVCYFVT